MLIVRTAGGAVMVVAGVRAVGVTAPHPGDEGHRHCRGGLRMVVRVVVPGLGAVEGAVVVVLVVGAVRRTVVVVAGVRTVGVTAPHAADVGHRSQGLRLDRGRFRLRRGRGDRLRFRRGLRLGLHRRRGPDCRRVVGLFVVVLVVVTGLGAVEGAIMVVLIIRAVHGAVVVVAGVRAVGIGTPHPGHKGHGARLRRRLLWSSARRLAAASGQQEYQCQQADPNLIVPHNRNSLLLWFLSHSSVFNTTTVVRRCQEGPAHSFLSGGESRGRCYKRFLKKDKCFI